jgi:hypothetical protein
VSAQAHLRSELGSELEADRQSQYIGGTIILIASPEAPPSRQWKIGWTVEVSTAPAESPVFATFRVSRMKV